MDIQKYERVRTCMRITVAKVRNKCELLFTKYEIFYLSH